MFLSFSSNLNHLECTNCSTFCPRLQAYFFLYSLVWTSCFIKKGRTYWFWYIFIKHYVVIFSNVVYLQWLNIESLVWYWISNHRIRETGKKHLKNSAQVLKVTVKFTYISTQQNLLFILKILTHVNYMKYSPYTYLPKWI